MYIVSQKYVTVYTDVDMDETGSVIALCTNQIETLTSPPRHTPWNLDFDVLVRSNSLHIFVIPIQIHHVL
jgi:hypothetical protein